MNSALVFVLFGSTGDLAQKKIMPALLSLFLKNELPKNFVIIAFSRRQWDDKEYRVFIRPYLEKHASSAVIDLFLENVRYSKGNFDEREAYVFLKKKIEDKLLLCKEPADVIYHLAIQPEFYEIVFEELGMAGLNNLGKDKQKLLPKILIEKPFGNDLESALHLQKKLETHFSEDQIYRIDHYLAKPGLNDFVKLRKEYPTFDSILNKNYVQSIHIELLEKIDIQGRGEFYDATGAIRDIGQNHIIEMLATVCMDIKDQKTITFSQQSQYFRAQVIKSLEPIKDEVTHVKRAQYRGYSDEQDAPTTSKTETYFKINTSLNTTEWKGVSCILEGGKAVDSNNVRITITFKDTSQLLCNIQPEAGIVIKENNSVSNKNEWSLLNEVLSQASNYKSSDRRDAYEILIHEALLDNKYFFASMEEVIDSWEFFTPILRNIDQISLYLYDKGTKPLFE